MEAILDILGNIGFDWKVALANLVNFLIIFYLLKRFAFPKIDAVLKERRETIQDGILNAEKANERLKEAKHAYEAKIDEGRKEAHEVLASARKEEKRIVGGAVEKAREAAEKERQAGTARMEAEFAHKEHVFKDDAADLVLEGVEKVLRAKMSKEESARFTKELLKQSV